MAHRLQDDINDLLQMFERQNGQQLAEALPAEDGKSWESEEEGAITETIHVYFVRESELEDQADEQVVVRLYQVTATRSLGLLLQTSHSRLISPLFQRWLNPGLCPELAHMPVLSV